MKLPPRQESAALQAVIDQGASAPAEKPAAAPTISSYTLRLYATKLQELTAARDARRARHRAQALPNANAISVHALILEGIDLVLKQEAKLAAKESSKRS